MAGEMQVTVIGNMAGDPELRFTGNGHAVANFTIAQTPRTRNQQSGEWVDDETLWVRCSVWRQYAENAVESLAKGMHVIATGRLKARSFEDKHGNQRTNWELDVDEIGPSLRWATAQVQRSQPANNNGGFANQNYSNNNPWGNSQYNQQPQQGGWGQPPAGNQPPPQNQPPQGPPQGQEGNVWAGGQPGGQQPPQQDAFGFDNNGPAPF